MIGPPRAVAGPCAHPPGPRAGTRIGGSGQHGFTLSELVLVVAFVAGLLLVISVSVGNIRRETSTSNCQTDLRTLKLATERYHAQNDTYPADKSVLLDARLVPADQVSRWTVTFRAGDTRPTYRALDASCR